MIVAALDSRWLEITHDLGDIFDQLWVNMDVNVLVSLISGLDVGWLVDGQWECLSWLPVCTFVCRCKNKICETGQLWERIQQHTVNMCSSVGSCVYGN